MLRYLFYFIVFLVTFVMGISIALFSKGVEKLDVNPQTHADPPTAPTPTTYDFFSEPTPTREAPRTNNFERKKVICSDPKIVPIWRELKKDKEFSDRIGYSDDSPNCVDMLELKQVDLNGTGRREILVRGANFHLCSAVGNCGFWIFERSGHGFRKLISMTDYWDVSKIGEQVLKTKTRGYSDILLRGHFSAAETGFYTYKYNGKKYIESKCLYEVPKEAVGDKTTWHFVTCEAFYKKLER